MQTEPDLAANLDPTELVVSIRGGRGFGVHVRYAYRGGSYVVVATQRFRTARSLGDGNLAPRGRAEKSRVGDGRTD